MAGNEYIHISSVQFCSDTIYILWNKLDLYLDYQKKLRVSKVERERRHTPGVWI